MAYIFLLVLVIILGLVATSQISSSVATAKQAQATIETARAAEIASTGNVITILGITLLVFLLIALAALALYTYYRTKIRPTLQPDRIPGQIRPGVQPGPVDMNAALNTLVQLKILDALGDRGTQSTPYLLTTSEDENNEIIWE